MMAACQPLNGGFMHITRKRVLGCVLAATLALGTSAVAADREVGPRGPRDRDRPSITKAIKHFVVHLLGDISIPPGK
jgi:hypothetical protein